MYKIGGAAYWRDVRKSLYLYNHYIQKDNRAQAGETWHMLINHLESDINYLKRGQINAAFVAAAPRVDLMIKRLERYINSLYKAWNDKKEVILL